MQLYSWLIDSKINGINVNCDFKIKEYEPLIPKIIDKNKLQRKKVTNNKTAYSLLKKDLLDGCVMPPIILAITDKFNKKHKEEIEAIIKTGILTDENKSFLESFLNQAIEEHEIIILDGLQRTYTLQSAIKEVAPDSERLERFYQQVLRSEIYIGLDKTGILYRMFTLNTGQTPMTFRHQLEMLYSDFLDSEDLEKKYKIRVLKETDQQRARGLGNYKYQDIIDMFYAFNIGSAQMFESDTLISKLKEMEFLKNYKKDSEDMADLLIVYDKFLKKLDSITPNWKYDTDVDESVKRPFGNSISGIFEKSQPMSGFGAACSYCLNKKVYNSLEEIDKFLSHLDFDSDELSSGLTQLVQIIDDVGSLSKKIGNSQRQYFESLFYYLLNPDNNLEALISDWAPEAYINFSAKYGL